MLEHPTVLFGSGAQSPFLDGLNIFRLLLKNNLQKIIIIFRIICFRMYKCAYFTPKSQSFPKAPSMGTHQDVSHLCHTGHQWGISHPTFCTGHVSRTSPGHIHCFLGCLSKKYAHLPKRFRFMASPAHYFCFNQFWIIQQESSKRRTTPSNNQTVNTGMGLSPFVRSAQEGMLYPLSGCL